jgi:uncharacterized protein DUF4384
VTHAAVSALCLIPGLLLAGEVRKIEVSVERKSGSRIEQMDPNHVFERGDLVRFRFKPSFETYLYVVDHSTSGKYLLLFPKEDTGLANRMEAGRDYLLPMTESGWFRVEGPPGHEVLYWVASRAGLDAPGAGSFAVPKLPAPSKPLDSAITPRCDDAIFRARGECIDVTAGAKPVRDPSELPENLSRLAGAKARELTVTKSDKKTAAFVPADEDALFIYTFRLAHK